ncbi:MAG: YkgJ family cysteine cluster protein [Thermodesulfobacteriota bacterium]
MTDLACDRCGQCCRQGGPALHAEDLPLVRDKVLTYADLFTLRRGEPARDQFRDRLLPLEAELVKLKGAGDPSWTCVFLQEPAGCGIYASRPLECRLLSCKDTAALAAAYASGRLGRADILPPGSALAQLAAEHEARCPVPELTRLLAASRAGDGGAARAAADMLAYDRAFRAALADKGLPADILPFLLGRPLDVVARQAEAAAAAAAR